MKIDTLKWNAERLKIESEIRDRKTKMRASGHMPTYSEYLYLGVAKEQATMLYKIRAQARGHQHQLKIVTHSPVGQKLVTALTMEEEAAQVQARLRDYVLPEISEAVA